MSGISGIGTTYGLPNYHGELINQTPTETPLLSLSGGIGGGKQAKSTLFEWQTEDLRAPAIRARLEGADAPTAESRVRANIQNVCQIFQEQVSTSYTKQATTAQYANGADGEANPVVDEHAHQVSLALKTIARDVNYAMWHSVKVVPEDNTTARKMAGLLSVIPAATSTGTVVTVATGATNTIAETGTALANGDRVVFTVPPAELRHDVAYYVVNKATDSFKVALTSGGTAITIADSQTGIKYVKAATTLADTHINAMAQAVFDNGGIAEGEAATLFVSSTQKAKLTAVYAALYGKANAYAGTRNVGGLNLQTIQTDFGLLNVVIERALAPDTIVLASMEQVDPVFLAIPGKGVLFEESLAKTGSAEKSQIYGEIGLKYGNPYAHGVIRGLAV